MSPIATSTTITPASIIHEKSDEFNVEAPVEVPVDVGVDEDEVHALNGVISRRRAINTATCIQVF
ncbi:MAG: hypothetical protein NVSMB38_39360 [Ktedonobacteraceae bacterium]